MFPEEVRYSGTSDHSATTHTFLCRAVQNIYLSCCYDSQSQPKWHRFPDHQNRRMGIPRSRSNATRVVEQPKIAMSFLFDSAINLFDFVFILRSFRCKDERAVKVPRIHFHRCPTHCQRHC